MSGKSQLGWVDFSSEDRDRVKHALKQLSEPGTLDELGIGGLRDGFADLMFPGFSTLQTRAKYFVTVPRIIRDYLHLSPSQQRKQPAADYLEEQEARLSEVLREKHQDGTQTGISGSSLSKGERVARQPSSIYWVGLRTWKLVDTGGSLRQFLQAIGSSEAFHGSIYGDEGDDSDAHNVVRSVYLDRFVPDWLDKVKITLTASEARFLSEKFKAGPALSLPCLLEIQGLREQALTKTEFPALAAWAADQPSLPGRTREYVAMAQAFSELIYGAHLRFNIILVRNDYREHDALLEDFAELWDAWRTQTHATPADIFRWLEQTQVTLASHTTLFLTRWAEGLIQGASDVELDKLVEHQARANKKERSVLNKQLPEGFAWLGMARLDYRWRQVRTVLKDIQEGVAC